MILAFCELLSAMLLCKVLSLNIAEHCWALLGIAEHCCALVGISGHCWAMWSITDFYSFEQLFWAFYLLINNFLGTLGLESISSFVLWKDLFGFMMGCIPLWCVAVSAASSGAYCAVGRFPSSELNLGVIAIKSSQTCKLIGTAQHSIINAWNCSSWQHTTIQIVLKHFICWAKPTERQFFVVWIVPLVPISCSFTHFHELSTYLWTFIVS